MVSVTLKPEELDPVKIEMRILWGDNKGVTLTGKSVSITGILYPREVLKIAELVSLIKDIVKEFRDQ